MSDPRASQGTGQLPEDLADERYCLLTTEGRVTGRRHTAELWFVPAEGGAYLMSGSGGLTQWDLTLEAEERGVLRIGKMTWLVRSAFLARDDPARADALNAFHAFYDPPGKDRRESWLRDATVAHLVVVREL